MIRGPQFEKRWVREYVEGSGFINADTYLPKYTASHTGYFKSRIRVGSRFLVCLFTEKCVAVGLIKVDSSKAGRHVDTFPAEPLVSVSSSDRGPCSTRDKITRCEESPRNPPLSVDNQTRKTVSCLLVASAYLSVGSNIQEVGPLPLVCFSIS